MSWWAAIMRLFGVDRRLPPDPARDALNRVELDVAGRLAKMKGVTRDDVLDEAYRRVRVGKESQSYRARPQ